MSLAIEDQVNKKKKKKMKKNRNSSNVDSQHATPHPENFSKFEGNELHEGEGPLVSKRNKKSKKRKVASADEETLVSKRNKKSKTRKVASTDCHTEMSNPKQEHLDKCKLGLESKKKKSASNAEGLPLRGMKKWLLDYHRKRPGVDVLMREIDDFIEGYEARLEKEREEREAAASGEGWTVVVHQKGRKKNVDAESGITVGSVAEAAAKSKSAKKKSKEVDMAFYRFQRREARRNEVLELQKKFDDDKKRIAQMRAARKFRPY